MYPDRQHSATTPSTAVDGDAGIDRPTTPPVLMSHNVSGPVDPMEFYLDLNSPPTPDDSNDQVSHHEAAPFDDLLPEKQFDPPAASIRSVSQSPVRSHLQKAPTSSDRSLNGMRSNPALLSSRQPGKVKDMANKFDRPAATARRPLPSAVENEKGHHRRPNLGKGGMHQTGDAGGMYSDKTSEMGKSDRRYSRQTQSPQRSSGTSFDTTSSLPSNATTYTTKSQPTRSEFGQDRARPLFGEITEDGRWNSGPGLVESGQQQGLSLASRRASEGSLALNQTLMPPSKLVPPSSLQSPVKHTLKHSRSRSEMNYKLPSMPDLTDQDESAFHNGQARTGANRVSRIPVSSGRRTKAESPTTSTPQSRSASNSPGSRGPSKSPIITKPNAGKENDSSRTTTSIPRNRYNPPPLPSPTSNQTLSAKIVAPLPKASPPLRSSRPRRPVNSAASPASQARALEIQRLPLTNAKDSRTPSDQWLGKPHDLQREQSRRKIPELGNIDFEERRAQIQRAISQSLQSSKSAESLKSRRTSVPRNKSRLPSYGDGAQTVAGVDASNDDHMEQRQSEKLNRVDQGLDKRDRVDPNASIPDLTIDTAHVPKSSHDEPAVHTPQTDPEDESPTLGRTSLDHSTPKPAPREPSLYLSATTYQPAGKKTMASKLPEVDNSPVSPNQAKPRLFTNAISPFRERDSFLMSPTDESPSIGDSASDFGRKWGFNSPAGDEGSIQIMLDDDRNSSQDARSWSESVGDDLSRTQSLAAMDDNYTGVSERDRHLFYADRYSESPEEAPETFHARPNNESTPRAFQFKQDVLSKRPNPLNLEGTRVAESHQGVVGRVIDYYQATGTLTTEMIDDMQNHMVDLHRLSANGGSNAAVVQNLLESILQGHQAEQEPNLDPSSYKLPMVTPDTPTGEEFVPGTVLVYDNTPEATEIDEDDFETKIRKADEEWERQQRGSDPFITTEMDERPTPPPKDDQYSSRSSNPRNSHSLMPDSNSGLQGTSYQSDAHTSRDHSTGQSSTRSTSPAPPQYAPPPPPSETNGIKHGFSLADASAGIPSRRSSNDFFTGLGKNTHGLPDSSRPSVDSQRQQIQLPTSQSMVSFSDSIRRESTETPPDSQTKLVQTASTGPEHKRLSKRRYIIRELLDTENTYYQDLKIIEDIYKATCTPDLVTPEDKKILFGNCDEVERFALQFYDEMRKATTQVYAPPKQHRWTNNKRGSYSTTQSDGTGQISMTDGVDDEKDRTTTIGRAFLANLPKMEQIYGSYLKNHDAANRRLSALVGTPTVKCWLDECHANASDITAAWDLDSLLVKPTQRVAKYPMLLQQLLETTPQDHPDHDDLKSAVRDSIGMLTRINDAKKRADLVDQIVNRKRKDSDVRSGIAKAFGRRTEKLKERVGIAEAFQDPVFDELAHKFGGHFIRLQICMRDVQDYMNRTEKAVELVSNFTGALELYTDVWPSTLPEIESKWRRYGLVIRDLTMVAFVEHKAAVQKRVLAPMIQCIKLHDGPQNAINKRKKRIVDYARCKSDERRGQKPDKRTIELSDMYVALNDQLKIELPKLYSLTATLVQHCLVCFLDIQLRWQDAWQRKLKPLLDAADIPDSIKQIEPAFMPDYAEVERKLLELSVCNGTLKQETAGYLSPSSTAVDSLDRPYRRRPSTIDSYDRTMSMSSEMSGSYSRRHSGVQVTSYEAKSPRMDGRMRSNSSVASRPLPLTQNGVSMSQTQRPFSNSITPTSSYSNSRPTTANPPPGQITPRMSMEQQYSPRPISGATYFTARPDQTDSVRFSGIFNSAMPPSESLATSSSIIPAPAPVVMDVAPPTPTAPPDTPVLFVCASLFEFSIDRTRREGGYPYLTYVQGEVFDVIAQKGELWLAKNQDDPGNTLGWIWEQHFIVLSQES